jgi:DNA-binding transcriptional MerR regulator
MSFSIKQIKSLLSEHGMPVDNLDKAAEEICGRHTADLESIKEERDEFKKSAGLYEAAKKELEALKANPDNYKEKYEKAKKDFDAYKAEIAQEKEMAAKKAAYTEICKDAGLNEKGIAKAVKYADWSSIELDENGKIKDPKEHIKSIKEEWAEHVETSRVQGANTTTPPQNNGGGALKTRDDIYKTDEHGRFLLDATQRQEALAQLIAAEQQQKG